MKKIIILHLLLFCFFKLNAIGNEGSSNYIKLTTNKAFIPSVEFIGVTYSILRLNLEYNFNSESNIPSVKYYIGSGASLSLGLPTFQTIHYLNICYGEESCAEVNFSLINKLSNTDETYGNYGNERYRPAFSLGYRNNDYNNSKVFRVYVGGQYIHSLNKMYATIGISFGIML
jgi:hypothetical protein